MIINVFILSALVASGLTLPLTLNPSTQNKPSQRFHYFDIDLLKAVSTVHNDRNVMISPASVKATLAMLLEGARGPGADEIRGALRLPSDQNLVRRQIYEFLLSLQKKSPGVTLEGANRIFIADYLSLKPEFSSIIRQNYLSDVTKVNFSKPHEAANTVNTWVNQVTHGLIPSLVEAANFDSSSMLLLANALYFKGNWENAFDARSTIVRCFHTPRQTCREVYMMEIMKYFNYADVHELDAQALEIPYQDGKYSMIILLPNKENGISDLVRDIPYKSLSSIVDQMEQQEVQVTLPRFKIDYSVDLVPMLQEVGIRTIFGARANLSGIINSENLVQVNNVYHKTHIEVNEQGSIAAAVTGAMVIPLMGSTSERFRADHPFLFFIKDLETGQILFEGKVVEPIEAQASDRTVNQQPEVQSYFSAAPPQPQQAGYTPSFIAPPSVQTQQPQYVQQQQNIAYVQQSQQNGYSQQSTSQGNNIDKTPIVFLNNEPEQNSVPIITPVKTAAKVTPPLVRFSPVSSQDNYANVQIPSRVTITRQTESQSQYSSRQVYPSSPFLPQPQYLMSAYQQPLPNYPDGIAFEKA